MKPLNLDSKPCSPVSSNCVIWQGPDIPCIKLCKGDTISDITYKLATELCTILDQLNVENYDLTCFNINACGPNDFKALIQFLIERICALEGIDPATTTTDGNGCPTECFITAAECFGGGTVNLTDYIISIGEKICDIVTNTEVIKSDVTNLDTRVTILENTPAPTFTIPSFILDCNIGTLLTGNSYEIDNILEVFINDVWCSYYSATGTASELLTAIAKKCVDDTDIQKSNGLAFNTNANWILDGNYNTVADAINNIWVVLCDLFNAYKETVVAAGTNVTVSSVTVGDVTTYTVNAGDTYDSGWKDLPYYDALKGYGIAPTTLVNVRPKIRIVGRIVTINGLYPIPLASDPAGLTLVTNINNWFTTNSPYIYRGSDGGYEKIPEGRMETISPILPADLRPDLLSYLNPAGHLIYRALQVTDGITALRTELRAMCPYLYIKTDGSLGFGTAEERQGFGNPALGFNSQLAEISSIYSSGDFLADYTSYGSGYTAAVDNRVSPASTYPIPFDIDTRDGYQLGGFYMYINNMFHLNPLTPMQDIIDAFDNL